MVNNNNDLQARAFTSDQPPDVENVGGGTNLQRLSRDFSRWLTTHPSDIGTRVKCGLYELKCNGPSPSLLASLAHDVAELAALMQRMDTAVEMTGVVA